MQIRFITRSGSNQFSGSSYYYYAALQVELEHLVQQPRPAAGPERQGAEAEDVLHQPGTRVGGPIVIPGLFDGRDKAFFFVNYEESRSPGQGTAERDILHPRAQEGIFRYTASGADARSQRAPARARRRNRARWRPSIRRSAALLGRHPIDRAVRAASPTSPIRCCRDSRSSTTPRASRSTRPAASTTT